MGGVDAISRESDRGSGVAPCRDVILGLSKDVREDATRQPLLSHLRAAAKKGPSDCKLCFQAEKGRRFPMSDAMRLAVAQNTGD
jgi:hypothetical protein